MISPNKITTILILSVLLVFFLFFSRQTGGKNTIRINKLIRREKGHKWDPQAYYFQFRGSVCDPSLSYSALLMPVVFLTFYLSFA
jgi:hypothetical protein